MMHRNLMAAALGCSLAIGLQAQTRKNVLFIISDDLTATALSCYGNAQCKTPAIDRLARRGVRFTRTYCQYPVCGPSRAALMSGMYCQSIGVMGNGQARRFTKNLGDRPSMAGLFRRNGWHTARISKIYHMRVPGDITAGVSGPDHAASWDERFNCQGPEWMTEGKAEQLTRQKLRFDRDKHYNLGFGTAFYVVRGRGDGTEQADVKAADKAVAFLKRKHDQPFFLAVGLVRPHVPLVAPESFFVPYPRAAMRLPHQVDNDWDDIPRAGISKNSKRSGLTTQDRKRGVLSAYYAAVAFMDAQVGRILDVLEADAALLANTIVVFTSDHGYHLGEHEFWQKLSLHEESTRIPLIIAKPGSRPGVAAGLAQQIDIYPTLAELCGLGVPPHVQGKSLAPLLEDHEARVHDAVYSCKQSGDLLRTERWAYLSWHRGGAELYDMKNDPHQFTNLAASPEHAVTHAAVKRKLTALLSEIKQ